MTNDERRILVKLCDVLRDLIACQQETDRSWRSLYLALKQNHFPDMDREVADHRKDALFATELSLRLGKVAQALQGVSESLKKSSGD